MFGSYSFAVLLPSVCRGKSYSSDVDTTCIWKMLEIEVRYSIHVYCEVLDTELIAFSALTYLS